MSKTIRITEDGRAVVVEPRAPTPPVLTSHNLAEAQVALIESALDSDGTLVGAAQMLGITRHALKRRIIANNIAWPRPRQGGGAT